MPDGSAQSHRLLQVCAVDFTARRFLLPLMRAQRAAGFDVHLACAPGPDCAPIEEEGFPVHPIAFERSTSLPAQWRAWRQLAGLLRTTPCQIVHTHTPVASLVARPVARRASVPVVVYTAHGFYFHDRMKFWVRRAHIMLETWAQRYADLLWTQSEEDARTAIAEGIAPAGRVLAIGNGVDVARFSPDKVSEENRAALRAELGLEPGDGPVVVIVGRLVREKGYLEFIDALARLKEDFPRLRAIAIGSQLASDHDAAGDAITERAKTAGLDKTLIFAGLRNDVSALLSLGGLFCLPSWREGMPRSLIEAMAAGMPVVATDIRGCREEVVPGETGLLVPVDDAGALAGAMGKILANRELSARMGRAGRERALKEYDESVVIGRQMDSLKAFMTETGLSWPKVTM